MPSKVIPLDRFFANAGKRPKVPEPSRKLTGDEAAKIERRRLGKAALPLVGLAVLAGFGATALSLPVPQGSRLTGEVLQAGEAEALFSPAAGTVIDVSVRPGEEVRAGQVLARLDTFDLEDASREALEAYYQAHARLARIEAAAEGEVEALSPDRGVFAGASVPVAEMLEAQREALLADAELLAQARSMAREGLSLRRQAERAAARLAEIAPEIDELDRKVERARVLAEAGALDSRKFEADAARLAELQAEAATLQARRDEAERLAEVKLAEASEQADALRSLWHDEARQARAQLEAASAVLERLAADFEGRAVVAEFDGVVGDELALEPGALVSPDRPLLELTRAEDVPLVTVRLSPELRAEVNVGDAATVSLQGVPDAASHHGTVLRVAERPVQTDIGDYYLGVIRIEGEGVSLLRPGAPVDVSLVAEERAAGGLFGG